MYEFTKLQLLLFLIEKFLVSGIYSISLNKVYFILMTWDHTHQGELYQRL